ncbi:class I SAM-dependent RNA methyltransferase [Desulfofustis glycolicus]|uniref:class I SAM-dependent RNA methyltransferase n=1 Tax=Desulfofustis glycolicus TaxID=51195 RepID=UPI00137B7C5B|nr:class I SAM-dependent RNA methyltransferase [Desulfofustis glycolicus]MCB2215364.1 class I SAM-dependent RNA methyltransferase [Desulfobulbaceae bacterium]
MNCKNSQVVTIKKVVNGGYGLASLPDGKTVLVQFGLPGETATIAIDRQHKQLDHARATAIVAPHRGRIEPPCPFYGRCGGCNLQHANYDTQCRLKHDILVDLFARSPVPAISSQASSIAPVRGAAQPFGYRQRIRLRIDDRGQVGFHRFHSHQVVPINRCLLAHPLINESLNRCGGAKPFRMLAGNSESVEFLLDPRESSLCLLFQLRRPPRPADRTAARQLGEGGGERTRILLVGRNFAAEGPFGTPEGAASRLLSMELPGTPPLMLAWEAGGFSQVNNDQNRVLIDCVTSLAAIDETSRVLDLFCGMGNFSLPLARRAAHVLGIESQGSAIRSARLNAARNNLDNLTFRQAAAVDGCRQLVEEAQSFDVIVCDPPRQGMPGLAALLGRLCHDRLIYVSCDPATLVRDCAELTATGFRVVAIQPIDMFPQTHHIETVVLLEKN